MSQDVWTKHGGGWRIRVWEKYLRSSLKWNKASGLPNVLRPWNWKKHKKRFCWATAATKCYPKNWKPAQSYSSLPKRKDWFLKLSLKNGILSVRLALLLERRSISLGGPGPDLGLALTFSRIHLWGAWPAVRWGNEAPQMGINASKPGGRKIWRTIALRGAL